MPNSEIQYDIIFTGGGAAALSLLYRGFQEGVFQDQHILIIDPSAKNTNDRTWCFWQEQVGPFEEIIYKRWDHMSVFSHPGEELKLQPGGYSYKMLRSIDFYQHVLEDLTRRTNVTFLKETVEGWTENDNGEVEISAGGAYYSSPLVFNSIYQKPKLNSGQNYFLQHFLGEIIKLPEGHTIDFDKIHLMDFRTSQHHGCAFFYLLPLHNNEVLVEYTLFTKDLLDRAEYKATIKQYLTEVIGVSDYEVLEEERGEIPMTDASFKRFDGNVVNIGSAGGDTRGSSGYTFSNIQRTVSSILESYQQNGHPFFKKETISKMHQRYDSALLKVMDQGKYLPSEFFYDLFKNAPAPLVFKFLDGQTNLIQDFTVMKSMKARHFIKPFFESL